MARRAGSLAAVFLVAASAAAAEPGTISREKVSFKGKERVFFLFVPAGVAPEKKLPLILTLHGSGQDPEAYVSAFKDLAEKESLAVVGPASGDSIRWASPEDGPLLLHDIIEQVAAKISIDGRRLYLFGHSAGAVFALQMAALESEYFAAAAAYAGSLEPRYFKVFDYATRKIPYLIGIGTDDRVFPLEDVRETRSALKARGFPVEYFEMSGQTHEYLRSAREINRRAWGFFQRNPLPANPKYTVWDSGE
jgi:poly(3-hydroxybutyrate) depolymerase